MPAGDFLIMAEQYSAENSGLGVYALEVGSRVALRLVENGYSVSVAVRSDAVELGDRVRSAGGSILNLGPRQGGIQNRMREMFIDLPRMASGYGCYHSLDHKIPPRMLVQSRRVITIHDTCPLDWPGEFDTVRQAYFGWMLPRIARASDMVVTVSDFAARRIQATLGIPREAIVVAPNGFDSERYSTQRTQMDQEAMKRFDLQPGYFLFVGRVSPRKNLRLVVEAAKRLRQQAEFRVVLAGPPGYRDEADWAEIRAANLASHFRKLNYVPGELLPALYRNSAGLLYPSRCEGFGIPVLEALACGVPALVAEGTSAAEVGGPYAIAVNPDDSPSVANIMLKLMDGSLRTGLMPGITEWLEQFQWDRTADVVASGLQSLLPARSRTGPAAGV